MRQRSKPIRLPTEDHIQSRLTELATEANALRSVLRIVRRKHRIEQPTRTAGSTREGARVATN